MPSNDDLSTISLDELLRFDRPARAWDLVTALLQHVRKAACAEKDEAGRLAHIKAMELVDGRSADWQRALSYFVLHPDGRSPKARFEYYCGLVPESERRRLAAFVQLAVHPPAKDAVAGQAAGRIIGSVRRLGLENGGVPARLALARQIARALDGFHHSSYGWRFADRCGSTGAFEFREAEPYPCTWPKPEGGVLSSPPGTLELRDWETDHVRFWSADPNAHISVSLIWNDAARAVLPATRGHISRILTLHPYNSAWPLCWVRHYVGDFYVKPGRDNPFSFGPRPWRSPATFVRWVLERLDEYAPLDVAVIPEFCMTPRHRDLLYAALEERLRGTEAERATVPGILVPGSWYRDTAPTESHYEVWVRGSKSLLVHPATKQFPLEGEWATRKRPATFQLLQCGRLRVAVGLCRDLLNPDVAPLLRRAGVNVVIAPANSTNTEVFANELRGITAANQAIGVVANSPSRHPGWDLHARHPPPSDWLKRSGKHKHRLPDTWTCQPPDKEVDRGSWSVTDLAVYSHPAASSHTLASGPLTGADMSAEAIARRGAHAERSPWTTLLELDHHGAPVVWRDMAPALGKEHRCDCTPSST